MDPADADELKRDINEPVHSDRVQAILAMAGKIFAEKGFDGTSMRDISEACGVSKALLYHHFESKDNFYAQIAFNSTQSLYDYVYERIPNDEAPAEKVRAYMRATAEFFEQHRWAWIAASTAFWNDPNRHRLVERVRRRKAFEHLLRALLQEGIDRGEFEQFDVAMTGRLILSSINWMHRWYNPEKELHPRGIVDAYYHILMKGLLRRA